jgi:hypothetical protein
MAAVGICEMDQQYSHLMESKFWIVTHLNKNVKLHDGIPSYEVKNNSATGRHEGNQYGRWACEAFVMEAVHKHSNKSYMRY